MRRLFQTGKFFFLFVIFLIPHFTIVQSSADEETCANPNEKQSPQFLHEGRIHALTLDQFQPQPSATTTTTQNILQATIPGAESVRLRYVKEFLSPNEVEQAIQICNDRQGWTNSRQNQKGDATAVSTARTSYSCPLIWPLLYLPKLEAIRQSGRLTPALESEIQFAWTLIQRISDFLGVDAARIEPLQLVRYQPGQFYKQHHDHGSYYGANTEQRPMTLLLFLSTVPAADGGGHTKFSKLDVAVLPKAGDGILWDNVDQTSGEVLQDALHEAVPPQQTGSIIKYAMNVWIADEPIMPNINAASYRTS